MISTRVFTLTTLYLLITSVTALPSDFWSWGQSKAFWARPKHNPHWDLPKFNLTTTDTTYLATATGTGFSAPTATGPSPTGWYKDHVKKDDAIHHHLGFGNWAHQWHSTGASVGFPTSYPTAYPTATGSYPITSSDGDESQDNQDAEHHFVKRFEGPRKGRAHGYGKAPHWHLHGSDYQHPHPTATTGTAAPWPTVVPSGAAPTEGWY